VRQRTKLLSFAAIGGLFAALLAPQAAQAAPDSNKTYKVVPYVISSPSLVKNPAKVVAELEKAGNLNRFGIAPATADGPSKMSTLAPLAEPTSYVVDSSRFPRGTKPADIYDYATDQQCDENDATYNDAGWIKNRYSYCQSHLVVMPAYECTIFPPRCRQVGLFMSTNRLIGYGKVGGQENDVTARWANFWLHATVLTATGPFAGAGAEMTATMECDGNYLDDDYPQTDANACFSPEGSNETEKSIGGWRRDGDAHFDLKSQASEPADFNGEQLGTGVFHIEYDFDLPWFFQFIDTESPEGGMRFDSAWYLSTATAEQLGSVFDRAVPGLSLNEADPAIAGAARHIEDARTNPAATDPPKADKVLHGATPSDPLHRLPGAKSADTRARLERNRMVSTNYCRTVAMPPQPETGGPFDCDEYAMASTYEGSARSEYDGAQYALDYSVRWVNRDQNQEAGRRFGRWYDVDRLIDKERFFMITTDSGPLPPPEA
jgi:hypothetical protein